MAAKQVPYTIGKQVGFDLASRLVRAASAALLASAAGDAPERDWIARFAPVMAALPAAVTAAVLSHPGDMVLTEYYKSSGGASVVEALRGIVSRGGAAGLFVGLRARLVHVVSIIWVQLVMYDKIKVFLGLPATGSH
jgi:solute carrier family 25 phosphate transporter 3